MLRIHDLVFDAWGRRFFDHATVTLPVGAKVGLVGRNGAGKTTLFKLILGQLSAGGGDIDYPKAARVAAVEQEHAATPMPLLETVLAADTERASLFAELETAAPERMGDIYARLSEIDADRAPSRAAEILAGLGFSTADLNRPSLGGGGIASLGAGPAPNNGDLTVFGVGSGGSILTYGNATGEVSAGSRGSDTFFLPLSISNMVTLTSPELLASFHGLGTFGWQWKPTATAIATGPDTTAALRIILYSASVTYTYTPVPEPSSIGLAVLGALSLLLCRARRNSLK